MPDVDSVSDDSESNAGGLVARNSTPIIVMGDGLQGCLPLPKEVGDHKFSIPLPSHKLYLCLWESGVYSPQ